MGKNSVALAAAAERRRSPRTGLAQFVRVRPADSDFPVEYCDTFNVSWAGVYLKTSAAHYVLGMTLYLTSDFVEADPNREEIMGAVVRIDKLEDGRFGVAVDFTSAI
jgi:hypothetical protein